MSFLSAFSYTNKWFILLKLNIILSNITLKTELMFGQYTWKLMKLWHWKEAEQGEADYMHYLQRLSWCGRRWQCKGSKKASDSVAWWRVTETLVPVLGKILHLVTKSLVNSKGTVCQIPEIQRLGITQLKGRASEIFTHFSLNPMIHVCLSVECLGLMGVVQPRGQCSKHCRVSEVRRSISSLPSCMKVTERQVSYLRALARLL